MLVPAPPIASSFSVELIGGKDTIVQQFLQVTSRDRFEAKRLITHLPTQVISSMGFEMMGNRFLTPCPCYMYGHLKPYFIFRQMNKNKNKLLI